MMSHVVWLYHRFNHSYRDIQEQMAYRGIILSHETIRSWCYKFSSHFKNVIKKQERRPKDKWHLDEMTIRINGEYFVLWRAADSDGCRVAVSRLLQRQPSKNQCKPLSRHTAQASIRLDYSQPSRVSKIANGVTLPPLLFALFKIFSVQRIKRSSCTLDLNVAQC